MPLLKDEHSLMANFVQEIHQKAYFQLSEWLYIFSLFPGPDAEQGQ